MTKNICVVVKFILLFYMIGCSTSTEPGKKMATINGTIRSVTGTNSTIHPAYIFLNNSLFTVTDEDGKFSMDLENNSYIITCSALDYRDTTSTINIDDGNIVHLNFIMTPDSTTGFVYGEFQDLILFNEKAKNKSEINDWTAQQICDGNTGATIQIKTLKYDVPPQYVYLGDSLMAVTDFYGQYLFEIQCGTYPFKGTCSTYIDSTQVTKVLPKMYNYMNFFLESKPE